MLPRISAALAQFIAPIATSGQKATSQDHRAFDRFKPGKEPRGGKEHQHKQKEQPKSPLQQPQGPHAQEQAIAQVIPFPLKQVGGQASVPPTGPVSLPPAGVSQALMQLMSVLQEQRASILRWLGDSTYRAAERLQKKNGRCRKGTIIDQKVE